MSDESLAALHGAATAPFVPPRRVRNASAMDFSAVQPVRRRKGTKGPSAATAATEESDEEDDAGAGVGVQELSGPSASQPKWDPFAKEQQEE